MDKRVRAWTRRNLTESRLAVGLVVVGAPTALAGAALFVLPGPGSPLVVIGLSLLITGLAMLGSTARRH